MSDLQAYYDNYATQPSRWASPDRDECACHGSGWWGSELDTWHACPYHHKPYFPHPEDEVTYEEHAIRCLVGFLGRCQKVTPAVPSGPEISEDDIPF